MTKAVPFAAGSSAGPLATVLRGTASAISGLQANLTQSVPNSAGHGMTLSGPDISHVPVFQYSPTPVMMATGLSGVGIARTHTVVTFTITTVKNSTSATVSSAAGLADGMQICDIGGNAIPQLGAGTTITNIAGTTITLSQEASASETSAKCIAATWTQL